MRFTLLLLLMFLLISPGCKSQGLQNRKAAVAGSFYPADPEVLKADLRKYFNAAKPPIGHGTVLAIISPHAGYPYSGIVAASAFNQIDKNKKYDNIFVIGSSHRVAFEGAAIYNKGNFETPLGVVKVNLELANKLINENDVFTYHELAHVNEHSLEVQLPFLQYLLKDNFQIVPILLGTHSADKCYRIAEALAPYFNEKNLFVISSDFSHYPDYKTACTVDRQTAEAIQSNSVEKFADVINSTMEKKLPGLETCLCAWPSVLTLLYITGSDPEIEINLVDYRNSGDSEIGDKASVVGYNAISFVKPAGTSIKKSKDNNDMTPEKEDFVLTDKEKQILLGIARNTIEKYVRQHQIPEIDTSGFTGNLFQNAGAFVTLNEDRQLRGCIGRFDPNEPLYKVVQDMAISSATRDYRFTPVTPPELDKIEIEISVLTPLKKINNINEIVLGKHGIYIRKGFQSGTFLPQVADKTGWTVEEFLGHCAKDKANIGWDGWKDAEIYTYEAIIFSESRSHNQESLK
jgi:AmmeMemoRadiSam system protein B/AmmeMemoRadiSam system protein A